MAYQKDTCSLKKHFFYEKFHVRLRMWNFCCIFAAELLKPLIMRKLFTFFAALLCVANMSAEIVKIGDFYYEFSGTTAKVVQHNDYKSLTQAFIPSSVTYEAHEYTVTTIAEGAFESCTSLLAVSIPSTVTTVGDAAFASCTLLDSVAWHPVQLPSAGYVTNTCPFHNDANITKFTFGATVQRIPAYLCYYLSGIKSIEFPEGLQSIGANAFNSLSQITEVVLPNSVTSIGQSAFANCSNLASINIPPTLSAVPRRFCYGSKITEITIPASVSSIGDDAFAATKLTEVTIPENITSVGNTAFGSCPNLQHVVWNAKSATAGSATNTHPFYSCHLISITFGEQVTSIPSYLCYGQSTLTDVFNYAYTPQTITANVFTNVNKNTCVLYVPIDYISQYQAKDVWKDFLNIIGVATGLQYEDKNITVTYRKKDGEPLYMEQQLWSVPVAPLVEGFTFLRWEIQAGNLEDGIILQAVYQSNDPTDAPAVYTNPEDPAQKLIREGNVYILRDNKMYTIRGQRVH